jgi:glycosyltransferase involved in cell wall biosynthesis
MSREEKARSREAHRQVRSGAAGLKFQRKIRQKDSDPNEIDALLSLTEEIQEMNDGLPIFCILSSYNRPTGFPRALNSIKNQSYKNWTCYVMDDGSEFDIQKYCDDPRILLFQSNPSYKQRLSAPGFIIGINNALNEIAKLKKSGVIAYLCDDDWFYPNWFAKAAHFFELNKEIYVMYGIEMCLDFKGVGDLHSRGALRFPSYKETVHPGEKVDHCQVVHRTECIWNGLRWPMQFPGDRFFFEELAKHWRFTPHKALSSQKAYHVKALNSKDLWVKRHQVGLKGWRE